MLKILDIIINLLSYFKSIYNEISFFESDWFQFNLCSQMVIYRLETREGELYIFNLWS